MRRAATPGALFMAMAWGWWGGKDTSRGRAKAPPHGLALEGLEARLALSAVPANAPTWLASLPSVESSVQAAANAPQANLPQGTPGPTGFTPAQIRHAYGLDTVTFGAVPANGAGTTIAIVTAYDSPNIAADLATFDAAFVRERVAEIGLSYDVSPIRIEDGVYRDEIRDGVATAQ